MRRIKAVLTPDLLDKRYRTLHTIHPTAGHCYAASEALFHALGGKDAGLTARVARDADGTHWWLATRCGKVLDVTREQYTALGEEPPYHRGKNIGFLTREPSRRAQLILSRAGLV